MNINVPKQNRSTSKYISIGKFMAITQRKIDPLFITGATVPLLSPVWYLTIKSSGAAIWLAGYLILLTIWFALIISSLSKRNRGTAAWAFQICIGAICFLPYFKDGITFICWSINGFAP